MFRYTSEPHLRLGSPEGKAKTGGKNSNDGDTVSVKHQRLAEHIVVGRKVAVPRIRPSQSRRRPRPADPLQEEKCARDRARRRGRGRNPQKHERRSKLPARAESPDSSRANSRRQHFRVCGFVPRSARTWARRARVLWCWCASRIVKSRMHEAKDGGVCADSQRQGEQGHRREPGFFLSIRTANLISCPRVSTGMVASIRSVAR
jgi:hypothetical protein